MAGQIRLLQQQQAQGNRRGTGSSRPSLVVGMGMVGTANQEREPPLRRAGNTEASKLICVLLSVS